MMYLIFTHSAVPSSLYFILRGKLLAKVNDIEFIGMHIDDKISFKYHFNGICNKIYKSVGVKHRVKS